MALVAVFVCALALAALAIVLFIRAGRREREEEILLRLRAMGGDESAYVMRSADQVRNPVLRALCHFVWRTGAELTPDTIVRILLVLVALGVVAVVVLGVFGGLSATAFLLVFGWAWLNRQAARRRAQIVEQLPAFLEGVIRVLGAGNTLDEAISAAARESPDPIRPLFLSVGRQVRLGAPIESVLMEAAEIHQLRDLKVIALAAAINRKYGGSLRNVLRSLIQAVRARDMAARELRALTAETRFSAMVLSIIPVGLMLYIFAQNPDYYRTMWNDAVGRWLLIGSVILQLVGVLVIYRMMRSTEDPT
ncbi:tight adherence protein B [Fontimonas thermophila]|uniref:Tight adherence protein B n=1 Tax=Fontimonas thermophila TaxID=1076937 RepID=A0A1I2IAN5_9GAMM|nr:type II secretion system F family protein [Fontimonas thermophila]SFF38713.1 tight adherence protein B [Fontimonas thermophila]